MLHKFIIGLFLSAISLAGYAQKIAWSSTTEIPKDTYIKKIIGEDDQGHFMVLRGIVGGEFPGSEHWIERYDRSMNLEYSNKLNVPQQNNIPHRLETIIYINKKLWLFTATYNKTRKRHSAWITEISPGGEILASPKEVDHINATKIRNIGSFDFRLSTDSTKILVYHNEPYERFTKEKFSYKVIDQNLNILWEKKLELPYKNRDFEIKKYLLDGNGDVHLLSKIIQSEETWTQGNPNFHYSILSYSNKLNKIREYEINLNTKSISDITFRIEEDGNLMVGGYYSQAARSENQIAGTFFMKVNTASGKVVSKGLKSFEKAFITEFIGQKKAEKGKELNNFSIDHFISTNDGGSVLIGEQVFENQSCYTDPRTGFTTCNDNYYYNDIALVKFNANGKIEWTKRVPKRQYSINDNGYYSSYVMSYKNDQIHLAFNDNPQNFEGTLDPSNYKSMTVVRKSIVNHIQVSPDGSIDRKVLFNNRDEDINLRAKVYKQSTSGNLFIYGQRKRNYRFGRIEF